MFLVVVALLLVKPRLYFLAADDLKKNGVTLVRRVAVPTRGLR